MDERDEFPTDDTDIEGLGDRIDALEQRLEELSQDRSEGNGLGVAVGYMIGTALAITLSWFRNASILWCIVHGMCSWIYVIYFAFTRTR